jgi:hypothetical protein
MKFNWKWSCGTFLERIKMQKKSFQKDRRTDRQTKCDQKKLNWGNLWRKAIQKFPCTNEIDTTSRLDKPFTNVVFFHFLFNYMYILNSFKSFGEVMRFLKRCITFDKWLWYEPVINVTITNNRYARHLTFKQAKMFLKLNVGIRHWQIVLITFTP